MKKRIAEFVKKEAILSIASILAVISMFIVKPDAGYADYIDFHTLAILFTLMVVMEGLRQLGVFDKIARVMLSKADDLKKLSFIMVFMCFISAMLITNDVALITFVPFTLLLLSMAGLTDKAIEIVVYETVAANLGSMLTPIGNPQNLYLFTVSGMGIGEFLKITAPITALSAVLLVICCVLIPSKEIKTMDLSVAQQQEDSGKNRIAIIYFIVVFILALCCVLKVLPVWIPFVIALVGTLFIKRSVLKEVDYCLLLTFVSFFVLIGNLGRIEAISTILKQVMEGREILISFLSSQVISNVPAAVLLSGFTTDYAALIKGTNIGGLGTLIASLASLISFKRFSVENPDKKGKYLGYFTLVNVVFAVVLLVFTFLIS